MIRKVFLHGFQTSDANLYFKLRAFLHRFLIAVVVDVGYVGRSRAELELMADVGGIYDRGRLTRKRGN